MKQKRIYNEARMSVVQLCGKSQLLSGSSPVEVPSDGGGSRLMLGDFTIDRNTNPFQ